MTFDIQVFTIAEESYVFCMESGVLFRSTPVLIRVLEEFHLGPKEVIKRLRNVYSVQTIAQAIADVQKLEKNQIIDLKVLQYLTNDYANLVSLQQVYLEDTTDETEKSLVSLLAKYHLEEEQIKLLHLEEYTKFKSSPYVKTLDPVNLLEWFLQKWSVPCRTSLTIEESNQTFQTVEFLERQLPEVMESLVHRLKEREFPKLTSFFHQVYTKKKKLFCCEAGLKSLIIGKDGQYYHCPESLVCGESKDYECLGELISVCDYSTCQECYARYFCGGPCPVKKDVSVYKDCELFRQVVRVVLIMSLFLKEKNSELAEQIMLDCTQVG